MNPCNKSVIPSVLVVSHDAGGAEILAAYIQRNKTRTHFIVHAGGPARAILKRERILFRPEPKKRELRKVIEKHRGAKALLGTGGPRSIELAALKEAKRQGMKTVAYLDSWTNFRERFVDSWKNYGERFVYRRPWRENLPDEIWAGDALALALAKKYFTQTRIRFVPNQYFAAIKNRYRARASNALRPSSILYMSATGHISEKLLEDFLTEYSRRKILSAVRVRIHPNDSLIRYERIIRRYGKGLRVALSREKDIVNDLLHARIVVGPETNALVLAHIVGIQTVRIVPPGRKPFLPFREIDKVRSAKEAVRTIGV